MTKIGRTISHNVILSFITALIFEVIIFMLPKVLFIIINTAVPPIIVVVLLIFHDYIDLDESDKKSSKLEFMTVLISILALLYTAKEYNLDYSFRFWIYVFLSTFALIILYFILNFSGKVRFSNMVHLLIVGAIAFIYCFGVVTQYNCTLDFSTPQKYNAIVIDKYYSTGYRSVPSFYIDVEQWNSTIKNMQIEVSRSVYDKIVPKEKVEIALKKGFFGVKWYYISN